MKQRLVELAIAIAILTIMAAKLGTYPEDLDLRPQDCSIMYHNK